MAAGLPGSLAENRHFSPVLRTKPFTLDDAQVKSSPASHGALEPTAAVNEPPFRFAQLLGRLLES
jgi:hypothetical protein